MTGAGSGIGTGRVSLAEVEGTSKHRTQSTCNPVPRSNQLTLSEVRSALQESQEQRDLRIRKLFDFFDLSHSGFLDRTDIEEGFRALGIPSHYKYAQDLLDVSDANHDGQVDFEEFHRYMDEKELELYAIFREIDVKHNGCIMPEELRDALSRAGIQLSDEQLTNFVDRIDKDNNGIITFEEWRDFLLLYPHKATIANIFQYWEKVCLVDIGEQVVIPEGISRHLHATKYLLAGGVAGALSRTATAPLDRLKVLLQVQISSVKGKPRVLPAILAIYKEGGFLAFFRGNGLNVIKVAPESAIKFYAYEIMKDVVMGFDGSKSKEDIGPMGRLFAGGTAGAIAQTAIYPMDLVKTRLQTYASNEGRAPTLAKLSKDIWQQEGPRAFYRGLVPSIIGMIPYAGIELAAYESLKNASHQILPNKTEPGPLIQLCCGMVSGAVGATCVYPLQLVRTRLQAQRMNSSIRYKGMIDVFQRTWKEEGFLAFYKGLLPNMLKVVPAASITYIVYEDMKRRLSL